MLHHTEEAKSVGDIVSVGLAFGTLSQILPQIAAVLSITWTLIRVGEWLVSKIKKRRSDILD
ncbi:hypothetical protein KRZ98_18360 [Sphingobium sp. AS12]|uniref:hypothetical protein n=1 Tax=Sphingobium sp. AS12 TaxID=2849495 RepID=UPI001C31D541|nr:hypothetical protein [Sphingobium sp. AS12]MBV2150202.1 hypothetical protein [Sphingobium sp. AS12]